MIRLIVIILLIAVCSADAARRPHPAWLTACMAAPTTVTTTAHVEVTFGGTGTYTVDHDLCELIWMQEGNTLTAHFEVWFRVTNVVGTIGSMVLVHDIPVLQGGQKLFGVVEWEGINLPTGYTSIVAQAGAAGITFVLLGDNVPKINLKYSHLTPGATVSLMGTASWWVLN